MKKENLVPTAIALILGLAGTLLLLFAWGLPPFSTAAPSPRTPSCAPRSR